MENTYRKLLVVAAVAAFVFGTVFATPALAGSTLFDDSTNAFIDGNSQPNANVQAAQPCDPAQVRKGGLSFLP